MGVSVIGPKQIRSEGSQRRRPDHSIALVLAAVWFNLLISSPGRAESAPPAAEAEASSTEADTLTGDWGGLRTSLAGSGITLGLIEQSEVWGNFAGGIRRGAVYDGLTMASARFDLEKLAGWTGATFFVNAYQIHGRGPSANLVGNIQLVSNLEATRDTKLYQMWLEQKFLDGRLTVRAGQEGANDQMMLSKYSALFLNSSFGFPVLAAVDLPSGAPNYPLATPFARAEFHVNSELTLAAAVFNGDPAPPGSGDPQLRDAGGTAFRLNGHTVSFLETAYAPGEDDGGLPAVYKLGAWLSSSRFADQAYDTKGRPLASPVSNGIPRGHSNGYAIYGIADRMVWQPADTKDRGIGVFAAVMAAPSSFNLSSFFAEAGVNWIGPFADRENDTFGLAVSYMAISPAARRYGTDIIRYTGQGTPYAQGETVVEATYLFQANSWWTLQPDIQVVLAPGANIPSAASARPLKNAVIAGLHTAITF